MQYFLKLITATDSPSLQMDSQRFANLKLSRQVLFAALHLEEGYEMIISNYVDLEKESLNSSVSRMVRGYRSYADFFEARLSLNRHLMNLLTSVRLYLDTLSGYSQACLPQDTGIQQRVRLLRSTQFEKSSDYRFMEALRNYTQHEGTAVHRVTLGGTWTALDADGLLEFSSTFCAEKSVLASDTHFNKKVLDEIPESVDLISASRGYIEALSSIHTDVRHIISEAVDTARSAIQTARDQYKAVSGKEPQALTAYAFDAATKTDEIPIFLDWDDIRVRLQKRNTPLVNLKRRYATGKTGKP